MAGDGKYESATEQLVRLQQKVMIGAIVAAMLVAFGLGVVFGLMI